MDTIQIRSFNRLKKFEIDEADSSHQEAVCRELDWLLPQLPNDGLYAEFGVYKGITINHMATLKRNVTLWGFDSFQGLPEDWDCGMRVTKEKFDLQGVPPKVAANVKLYQGWFKDTLPVWLDHLASAGLTKSFLSFLHVDCDLYSSTITILEQLNAYIRPGTVIRFDELCCWRSMFAESFKAPFPTIPYATWPHHEWRALQEWQAKYERYLLPICRNWHQGGTLVVIK